MTPVQQYFTLSLRGLGFGTFQTNLLAIPYTFIHILNLILITYVAEILQQLTFTSVVTQLWALPFLIYFNTVDISQTNRWLVWSVTTLLLGYPTSGAIQTGWVSRNSNAIHSRTVSAALYNMCVQASGIISSNIYRKDDAPDYKRGNRVLLGIAIMNIFLFMMTKTYYVFRNRQRGKIWRAMTKDQQLQYVAKTRDQGSKRLDFRFAH